MLSYNWDTIADYTLSKVNAIHLKNYAKLIRSDNVELNDFKDKGLFLKLHGSFNWMNCENKECNYHKRIRPPFQKNRYKLLGLHDLWTCECGSKHVKPLIVPQFQIK